MLRVRYLLLLLLVAYLATGIYQVGPDERAVVRRFGKVAARPGPGLGFCLPWGIDRVDRVPVRTVRQFRVGYDPEAATENGPPPGQMLTGDQNLVNVQLVIDYAIGETDDDLDNFIIHRDQVDATLARVTEAAVAEWAGGRTIDQVLLTGNAALPAWVMDSLSKRLPDLKLGIRVQRASVALLSPPDEVKNAFEDVNRAQTTIRTRRTQAEQYRDQLLSQADAIQYKLGREAAAFRSQQIEQAQADAAVFRLALKRYRLAGANALVFFWWEEVQQTLDAIRELKIEVISIDATIFNGEMQFYLPGSSVLPWGR